MKPIFETTTDMVLSGLALGLKPEQQPLWADGREINFIEASVQTVPPRTVLFDFVDTPYDVAQSFTLARRRLYLGTSKGVYRYVGPQTEYESPALLATQAPEGFFQQILTQDQDRCLLLPWGDNIISTDGRNPVKYDQNTGAMANLAGAPFAYARVIWKYFSHMFAADTDLSGRRVYWSAVDAPEVWTATLSNDAGSNPLRDLDSRIRAGVPIGTNQAIYSQDQMVLSRYVGGQDVFYFAPSMTGIGALNPRSIIPHNRFNWGLHKRGIFYTDGIQFDYVDEPVVRNWLKRHVNWDLPLKVIGWHDELNKTMCWVVPTDEGQKVIGYNYKGKSFTLIHDGAYFGEEADAFDDCLIGFENRVEVQNAGSTPASWIETKAMTCGDRTVDKLFQMVHFDWSVTDVSIELNFFDDTDENSEPFETLTFTQADLERNQFLHLGDGISALAMKMKISCPVDAPFRLGGFQLHGDGAGFNK